MKIKASPSLILGVFCLALVLLLGQSEQCGQHCNTTNLTNNGFGLKLSQRPSPPRPPPSRPPPPRPPPPTPIRPPPPRPPPPPPRPPPPRPPPPPPTPSPPPPPPGTPTLAEIFPEQMFNNFIINSMHPNCPGRGFYNYRAFMTAAEAFPEFGNIGDVITRKREIAAFFGQTSHETTGPLRSAYCYRVPYAGTDWLPSFCQPSNEWPCVPGRSYYGRGPVQLKWNYNYGQAGEALRLNLLSNPDLVANDRIVSFKTAIWFWMTPQGNKPSSHDVMTGQWTPSAADIAGNRFPGYGLVTNIFNGDIVCGLSKADPSQLSRINFYINYCNQMGVSFGDHIDCTSQGPFEWGFTHKLTRPRPALSSS